MKMTACANMQNNLKFQFQASDAQGLLLLLLLLLLENSTDYSEVTKKTNKKL